MAVVLTIPASPDFTGIVRTLVTAVAAQADLSYDQISDLTLAADEGCVDLMQAIGAEGEVRVSIRHDKTEGVAIELTTDTDPGEWPPGGLDGIRTKLLRSLCDRIDYEHSDTQARIIMTMRPG